MKNNTGRNLKLGVFVLLSLVVFVAAVYFIGNRKNLFGNPTRISSVFKNVNGLQLGNNVRYSGVNVGTVKKIEIINDTSICVDMFINESTIKLIKKNSLAAINSDGLVGSMIINIIPGESPNAPIVKSGDTIGSLSKIATADMLSTLNTTNENAALLTADLLKITKAINNGEGVLGKLIKDEKMAKDLAQSVSNLEKTSRNASVTIHNLNKIINSVNFDQSVAGLLLNDSIAAKKIEGIITALDSSTQEINQITVNFREFSEEINQGEGALNFVIKDTSFVNSVESTLNNIENGTEKFNENMEALKHNFLFRGYFRKLERNRIKKQIKDSQ